MTRATFPNVPSESGTTQKEQLLALLLVAGARGVLTRRLAREVGHCFGVSVKKLRDEGYTIKREPLRGELRGQSRYTLHGLANGAAPVSSGLLALSGPRLSLRQAYQMIRNAFDASSGGATSQLADVEELLQRQPELLGSSTLRNQLGQKKWARLLELARDLGLEEPPAPALPVSPLEVASGERGRRGRLARWLRRL